jgi:hypothetical protein
MRNRPNAVAAQTHESATNVKGALTVSGRVF